MSDDPIPNRAEVTEFLEWLRTAQAGADKLFCENAVDPAALDWSMPNERVGHILNEAVQPENAQRLCPKCGKDFRHWNVENYDPIWRDGDVVCECGERIRGYDAG